MGDGRKSSEGDEEESDEEADEESLSGDEESELGQGDLEEDLVTEGDVKDLLGGQSQIGRLAEKIFTQAPEAASDGLQNIQATEVSSEKKMGEHGGRQAILNPEEPRVARSDREEEDGRIELSH